jgi:hypothetical protein
MASIERTLSVRFPEAYREFFIGYGPLRFDGVFRLIVSYAIDLWDIRSFLTEAELLEVNRLYANAGLRASLVGFASDSLGNLFCFERSDLQVARDDAPVWFFDHEFGVDARLSEGFDPWLARYADLPAAPRLARQGPEPKE